MLLGHFTSRILNRDVTTVYTSEDLDSESGRFLGLQVLTLESPVVTICTTQWRTEGEVWGVQTPPKFRRNRWSPRSHKQEEPASRFPFI